jgi:hypothetical protein
MRSTAGVWVGVLLVGGVRHRAATATLHTAAAVATSQAPEDVVLEAVVSFQDSLRTIFVADSSGITGCSPRITSPGPPSRPMTKGNVGKRRDAATGGHAVCGHAAGGDATGDRCDSCDKPRSHDTSRRQRPNSWPGWGRSFR